MNEPARRNRLQFSLRAMLVFVALVGVDLDGAVGGEDGTGLEGGVDGEAHSRP